jgi:hypothetical protein
MPTFRPPRDGLQGPDRQWPRRCPREGELLLPFAKPGADEPEERNPSEASVATVWLAIVDGFRTLWVGLRPRRLNVQSWPLLSRAALPARADAGDAGTTGPRYRSSQGRISRATASIPSA